MSDNDELLLLMVALQAINVQLDTLEQEHDSLSMCHVREQRRLNRALPAEKKRVSWDHFLASVSDVHFRRMFRMDLPAFNKLCSLVSDRVGRNVFCLEACPLEKKGGIEDVRRIAGEVKMAISIRMLAGGSCLDLVPLFVVGTSHSCNVFTQFLSLILKALEFPLVGWLRSRNWEALNVLANHFAEKSNGVFCGPMGALDGLAVLIRSPRDIADPGNYYCRKGFCAWNVQATCDRHKRFLWVCPSNKGSTHDSAAWGSSRLVDLSLEMSEELHERGLFIVGDSACGLTPHLLTPCEQSEMVANTEKSHAKDAFNFDLSSCRIHTECAFGELVMRWGIFWRTLLFDLKKCSTIMQVAMLLHNYIIENRENGVTDSAYFANFKVNTNDPSQQQITHATNEIPRVLVGDNNEPRTAGRKSRDSIALIEKGNKVRGRLATKLAANDMGCPQLHDMKYNEQGHIYMTS